ncbi:MAG TPA: N-acetylmuramoyl-L-alanine amidase [Chloroflexota bacterium]|nr:N-acetylmuramoyl-L-alanine amidase [Chloroflexota bacterium]
MNTSNRFPRRRRHWQLAAAGGLLLLATACAALVPEPAPLTALPAPPPAAAPAAPPAARDAATPQVEEPGAPASEREAAPAAASDAPPAADEATAVAPASCDGTPAPLASLSPDERRRLFREPLPPAAVWDPPGPKRVGLQAGHWLVEQVPPELHGLQAGTSFGGRQEWEVNLDLALRTQALLEAAGVQVDVLPATVPEHYQAHAFVAIHADGDTSGRVRGFKVARPGFSSVPAADDQLVDDLNAAYGAATGLPRDDEHISLRMRYYYAFNSRRYCHAVAPGVPQAIIETGFLTNAADRGILLGTPDAAARGLADGILRYLHDTPSP